jgi:polysaccharide chain length determinant protein (PEP-CTERM system associated)
MFDEESTQKRVNIREYWGIVRRRRWWLLGPFFACWVIAFALGELLPASYRSETLILIEQQKVPEQYVVSNVAVDLQERLHSMTQQILSRTRLQRIIDQFHLYPRLRKRLGEGAVEEMRKDIQIDLVEAPGKRGELTAFKISYSAPNAQLAQQVATQLTSLFIDENVQEQAQQAESTTEFLSTELEDSRSTLAAQEEKIREFKGRYLGELPTQMQSNVQILTGLQERHQALSLALNRAQEQKLYLESLLNQYRSVKMTGEGAASLPAVEQELSKLKAALADAQTRYTDKHPDVIQLKGQIARTEKLKRDIETDLQKAPGDDQKPKTAGELQAMSPLLQVESSLKSNQQEIQNTHKQLQDVEAQIASYQSRLNLTPMREQQLADLTRDYEQSKNNYDSLLGKHMQSQLATNLEKRQQGQQFRIIDPPSLPIKPYWPNREAFSLFGLLIGLLAGIGGVAGMEVIDDSVRGNDDIKELVSARVLVGIPHFATPGEERKRKVRRMGEWCAAMFMLGVVILGNVLTFYKG